MDSMQSFADIKSELKAPALLAILSESVGLPPLGRLTRRAEGYMENARVEAYALKENDAFYGLIVVEFKTKTEIVIRDIAVAQTCRKRGFGKQLIHFVLDKYHPAALIAETDDGAVGFYRSLGFEITSLGEKYPGVVRYKCKITSASREAEAKKGG